MDATVVLIAWATALVALFSFLMICAMQIARKAGYDARAGLWVFVPVVNLYVLWRFARSRWPALTPGAVDHLRAHIRTQPPPA